MIFQAALPLDHKHLRPRQTLPQFLLDHSHPHRSPHLPGSPWLIDSTTGRRYDLEEIRERVYGLANALSALYGIKEKDVVNIHSPNDIDYLIVLFAIHRLGAVAVCSNPTWTVSDLEHQYRQGRPSFVITQAPFVETARAAAALVGLGLHDRIAVIEPPKDAHHPASKAASTKPRPSISDVPTIPTVEYLIQRGLGDLNADGAKFVEWMPKGDEAKSRVSLYLSSSGTSGKPKLVALSHFGLTTNIIQTAAGHRSSDLSIPWENRRARDGDTTSCLLPLFHVAGLVITSLTNLFMGLPTVIHRRYVFDEYLASLAKYRVTHLYLVPPVAIDVMKRPETKQFDLSNIRFILMGAAPVSATLQRAIKEMFPSAQVGQAYGMTEASSTIAMWPQSAGFNAALGSAGQLLPGWEAKLVKIDLESESGSASPEVLLGYDEPGELFLRGPSLALRYEGNEEATRETFVGGQWLRTGDKAIINRDGEIFIVDRLKELIKVRGQQVAPAELEGRLLGHPDVLDACVVGVPDERSGELPFAFIVLQPAAAQRIKNSPQEEVATTKSISKWVETHEAKYKWLVGGIGYIDAVPKNASGKILRRMLRGKAAKLKKAADDAKTKTLVPSKL
ncbi:amp dependent CoA ligase [Clavulina sp. PMI_390]|nr:amp dependent CoA ligase [Clavulina sp. PMI_390]